ncbi:MAG: penicillin-binding transpeptidase domain-containing protein [Chitinophagaceae bacterium]
MSDYNSIRSRVIRIIFGGALLVIIAQLFNLQLLSTKYSLLADEQGIYRKVVYPSRGLVYDRKGRVILDNTTLYDLVVIPFQLKGVDTMAICKIVGIDTAEFRKRVLGAIIKNGRYQPTIFQGLLEPQMFAQLNENLFRIQPGFDLIKRPVRKFPFNAAGPILGYLGEVDTGYLRRHPERGYSSGDYFGIAGLERSYEKVLMGERGIEFWLRDNKNRPTTRFEGGKNDTIAIAGNNLHTSIDIELQELGEKLMANKLGSIVAVDPKTGGILAMVSGPGYDPSLLTGAQRGKNIRAFNKDPKLPLLNRAISATYSPGSTFKTLQALIGLQEGVINTNFTVTCSGAFYGCGSGKPMRCLDIGTFNLRTAITKSDNTYFATVMQKVINNPANPDIDSSLNIWARYMSAFGLGHKIGVDIPSEQPGNIPNANYYNKRYGAGKWNYCTFRSVSIGQGEVNVTPLQVANEMAYIANKGWYKIPHVVDSIEGGDTYHLLDTFNKKHTAVSIDDSVFEAVHDGMEGVVDHGTGTGAKVKGIVICGKTGTVENYAPGGIIKRPNHAFFCAFAPRDNPKIAIMCVVQNSGRFGGTYAAPIVGLMIEKYLNDSIVDKARLERIEYFSKLNLVPDFIYTDYKRQDSIDHRKDTAYLVKKGYLKMLRDTLGLEDDPEIDEVKTDPKKLAEPPKGKDKKDPKDRNAATSPIINNADDKKRVPSPDKKDSTP